MNKGYKIFGIRKNPLDINIGVYKFKRKVSQEDEEQLNGEAEKLCLKLVEEASNGVESQLSENNHNK